MKKLTLKVDELQVSTFETAAGERRAGTVVAHGPPTQGPVCLVTVEDYSCGIWCPPTEDPQNTGPCLC